MRTKEQIKTALLQNLTASDNWQSLQHSVVGKELLAWAVETVYAQEAVAQTMVDSLDYNTATMESLISLCHMNDVATSFAKPSFIRVTLPASTSVYPPFTIKATCGAISFYNINYCRGGETVLLYQGSPIAYSNGSNPPLTSNVEPLPTTVLINGSLCYPIDILPDSIFGFFLENSSWRAISQYSPINHDADFVSYKVYTREDSTNVFMCGNGTWGAAPTGSTRAIVGLRPSFGTPTSANYKFFINDVETTGFPLIAFYPGEQTSLDYAKAYYRQKLLTTTVIQSASQIKDFVNSFPYVLDCSFEVLVADKTRVHIYIKPLNPVELQIHDDSSHFGEIELALDMHGSILSNYTVTYGVPVLYNVNVYLDKTRDESEESAIKNSVEEHLDYSKLPYDYRPSVSEIAAFIQANHRVSSRVVFSITENYRGRLSFAPAQNTLRFFQEESDILTNNFTAWDAEGKIYANASPSTLLPTMSLGLGRNLTNFVHGMGGLLHLFPSDSRGTYTGRQVLFSVDGLTQENSAAVTRELTTIANVTGFSAPPIIIDADRIFEEFGQTNAESITDADEATRTFNESPTLGAWLRISHSGPRRSINYTLASDPSDGSTVAWRTSQTDWADSIASAVRSTDNVPAGSQGTTSSGASSRGIYSSAEASSGRVNPGGGGTGVSRRGTTTRGGTTTPTGRSTGRNNQPVIYDTRSSFLDIVSGLLPASEVVNKDVSLRLLSNNGHAIFLHTNFDTASNVCEQRIIVFDKNVFWSYPDIQPSDITELASFTVPQDFPFDFSRQEFCPDYEETAPWDYRPLLLFHKNDPVDNSRDKAQLIWVSQDNDATNVHYATANESGMLTETFVYPLDSSFQGPLAGALVKQNGLSEDLIVFNWWGKACIISDFTAPTIHQNTINIPQWSEMKNDSSWDDAPSDRYLYSIYRSFENRVVLSWRTRNLTSPMSNKAKYFTAADFTYSIEDNTFSFITAPTQAGYTDLSSVGSSPFRGNPADEQTTSATTRNTIRSVAPTRSGSTSDSRISTRSAIYHAGRTAAQSIVFTKSEESVSIQVRSQVSADEKAYYPIHGMTMYSKAFLSLNDDQGLLNTNSSDLMHMFTPEEYSDVALMYPAYQAPIVVCDDLIVIGIVDYRPSQNQCLVVTDIGQIGEVRRQFMPIYEVYRLLTDEHDNKYWQLSIVRTMQQSGPAELFNTLGVIGTINYYTGDIYISSSDRPPYVSYEATTFANLSPKYFAMLKDSGVNVIYTR